MSTYVCRTSTNGDCNNNAENNGIFKGYTFMIGQRVTSRSLLISVIKENYGTIVKAENWADIIIGDYESGYAPPNSVTQEFIWETINKGQLQDIEPYRIGSNLDMATSRRIKPHRPVKMTKTPFTADDDKLLLDFCTKAAEQGLKVLGLKIYNELAQKHNHHTAQSWHDRFRRLSHLKSLKLPCDYTEKTTNRDQLQSNEREKQSSSGSTFPSAARNPAVIGDKAPTPAITESKICSSKQNKYECLNKYGFTEAETILLIDSYLQISSVSEDKMTGAWVQWAKLNPGHTAKEWHDYYFEYVKPRHEKIISVNRNHSSLRNFPNRPETLTDKYKHKNLTISSSVNLSHPKNCQDIIPSRLESCMVLRSSHEILDTSMELGGLQEVPDMPNLARKVLLENNDPMLHNEELFKEGLQDLAEELDLEVNFSPQICGRKISLMKLWQTVQLPEFGGCTRVSDRNLWQEIAICLGFDVDQNYTAQELRDCYYEILADFEILWHEFLAKTKVIESHKNISNESRSLANKYCVQEDKYDQDHITNLSQENRLKSDSSNNLLNSTNSREPHISRKKRNYDSSESRKSPLLVKRRRIRNGKIKVLEIPSTPENIINGFQEMPLEDRHSVHPFDVLDQVDEIEVLSQEYGSPSLDWCSDIQTSDFSKYPSNHTIESDYIDDTTLEEEWESDFSQRDELITPLIGEDFSQQKADSMGHSLISVSICNSNHCTNNQVKSIVTPINCMSEDDASSVNENTSQPKEIFKFSEISHKTSLENSDATFTGFIQEGNEMIEDELSAFISLQIAKSNISEDIVIEALEATSMSIGPDSYFEQVIESLSFNKGIPENLPGVWTKNDDEALKKPQGGEEYGFILRKHGKFSVQLRHDYWSSIESLDRDGEDAK